VVPEYRRGPWRWPTQLDNCRESLDWTRAFIHRYGGDKTKLYLLGQSAGGHMASLLALGELLSDDGSSSSTEATDDDATVVDRKVQEGVKISGSSSSIRGLVLYYPVLDLWDSGLRFPFSLRPLRIASGQPLLRWFFQNVVMHPENATATNGQDLHVQQYSPLHLLQKLREEGRAGRGGGLRVPPTLIVMPGGDSVICEMGTRKFLEAAATGETVEDSISLKISGSSVSLVEVDGAEHSMDIFLTPSVVELTRGVHDWLEHLAG